MPKKFQPSILIPELFYPVKRKKNLTAEVIENITNEDNFYESVEVGDGFETKERKRILNITEKNNLTVTQWLTFLIQEKGLDVSSIDNILRKKTVSDIKDSLYLSAEIGAKNIAIVTGESPVENKRPDALKSLFESLCEITESCQEYGMNLLVEPLDRFAHKKRVLGTTNETISLLLEIKEYFENIGIAFDTAHAALNDEDIISSIEKGGSLIHQIHFSNAILNPKNQFYGDYHIEIGKPGFLTKEKITEILKKLKTFNGQNKIRVACEVRGEENENKCYKNEQNLRNILKKSLDG